MLVIYIFMIIAFWAFPEDLNDNGGYYPSDCDGDDDVACYNDDDLALVNSGEDSTMCTSMISCYALFLVNGLTTGGKDD